MSLKSQKRTTVVKKSKGRGKNKDLNEVKGGYSWADTFFDLDNQN